MKVYGCVRVCDVHAGDDSDSTTAVNCTCQPGFVGDGFTCNADTWLAITELSAAKQFYRVIPTLVDFFYLYSTFKLKSP